MAVLDSLKLLEIFVSSDDFCQKFQATQLPSANDRTPIIDVPHALSTSEMMAIVIFYHHSGIRCFCWYYQYVVPKHFAQDFPDLCSYNRFVQKMPRLGFILYAFLLSCRLAFATKGNYVDATKLVVCHHKRIFSHKVFEGYASRGKSSTGWFFGFKLHAILNSAGQLVHFELTTGKVADNNQDLLRQMADKFQGQLYGDKGYLTAIQQELEEKGMHLICKERKNMKKKVMNPEQKYYLKHRGLIESCFDLMKNFCEIEHSRHRSPKNFWVNLMAGLIAYTFLDKTPSIPQYQKIMEKEEILKIELI